MIFQSTSFFVVLAVILFLLLLVIIFSIYLSVAILEPLLWLCRPSKG